MALNNVDNKKKIYEKELSLKLVPKSFHEDMKLGTDTQLTYQGVRTEKSVSSIAGYSGVDIETSFGQSRYYIKIAVEYYVNRK